MKAIRVKDRSSGGHSRLRMRAFSSIEITLGVGITLGALCVPGVAAATCRPGVRLDGDAVLVDTVGAALGDRGITTDLPTDSDVAHAGVAGECAAPRVKLGRRDDRITVSIVGGREPAVHREVTDTRTATTVIESWVRFDVEAPLLASRTVAVNAPPPAIATPPRAPAITATTVAPPVAPSGRGVQVFALGERSLANDGTAWLGVQVGACVSIGPLCVGARARFAMAGGRQLQQQNLDRHGTELLVVTDLPFRLGRATISPGIGAGIGSIHTHQDGSGGSEETGGPHADAHLSLSYPVWSHLAFELAASVDVAQTTHVETSSAMPLPDEPRLFGRLGAGVRFGGL